MRKVLKLSFLALVLCGATHSRAEAAIFDLAPPGKTPFFASNVGDARSFIFDANSSFTLNSVGIRMDPLVSAFNLQAELFSVTPATLNRASLLTRSALTAFTDNGLCFYDLNLPFAVAGGQRYELQIKPFGFGNFNMEFYNYQFPSDPSYVVGPITVLDGAGEGDVGGPSNSVISHFRINVADSSAVPEPASFAMLSLGILGLGLLHYSRRKAAG